jgi:hypothetical protein
MRYAFQLRVITRSSDGSYCGLPIQNQQPGICSIRMVEETKVPLSRAVSVLET